MKELKCMNCGAPLTADGRGEYCGARYIIERPKAEPTDMYIRIAQPGVNTYRANFHIDRWDLQRAADLAGLEPIIERCRRNLSAQLAEMCYQKMEILMKEDPISGETVFTGTMRVLDPTYRFRRETY